MILDTIQFGNVEYQENEILHFKSGIFGFEHLQAYIVIDDPETQPFRWLQSVQEAEVCFPLLDPFLFIQDYKSFLPKHLQNENSEKNIFVITTLKNADGKMTINLKGPILLNSIENAGQQIILNSEDVSTSHILN